MINNPLTKLKKPLDMSGFFVENKLLKSHNIPLIEDFT